MTPPKKKLIKKKTNCIFCNSSKNDELKYGKIHRLNDITTHYFCLLLSANMEQKGEDDDGILGFLLNDIRREFRRGQKLTCSYCKKKGATLGCCNAKCPKKFHLPCGLNNETLHIFSDDFRSYCSDHRPKDELQISLMKKNENYHCNICCEDIDKEKINQYLLSPCCRESAVFHRDCIQKFATSSGYFFKCPLCNNKKIFEQAMINNGIFIPSQDASWELEPDAFQELLYKYDHCDAEKCICPDGRSFTTEDKWELVVCQTCASQGIHVECGKLESADSVWNCNDCRIILNRSNNDFMNEKMIIDNKPSSSDDKSCKIIETNGIDDVTKNLYSNMKKKFSNQVKPGPRSFKLKLLKRLKNIYHIERRKLLRSIAIPEQQIKQMEKDERSYVSINEAIESLSNFLSDTESENNRNNDEKKLKNKKKNNKNLKISEKITKKKLNNINTSGIIENIQKSENSMSLCRRYSPIYPKIIINPETVNEIGFKNSERINLRQQHIGINNYSLISSVGSNQLNSVGNVLDNRIMRVAGPFLKQPVNSENQPASSGIQGQSNNIISRINPPGVMDFMNMFFTYRPLKFLPKRS